MTRSRPVPIPHPASEWRGWAPPLAAGLLLRCALMAGCFGLTMDSGLYVAIAEALERGRPEALGPAHPGYPALIALVNLIVPGVEWPGRIVALIAGLALIPLAYVFARRALSPLPASLAAWLVALHPLLAIYSVAIMTETTFLAIAYSALLALERGRPVRGGVLLGVSYWVRPEALVIAPAAALLMGGPPARRLRMLVAFVLALTPFLAYMRIERGVWSLSPKEVLVAPPLLGGHEVEPGVPSDAPAPSLVRRFATAIPAALPRYLPNLAGHLVQVWRAWPLPLLLLSAIGLARRRGVLAAPFAQLLVLPLLAVIANGRFPMLLVPALAVYAAEGAAWVTAVLAKRVPVRAPGAAAAGFALAGLAVVWWGPPGRHARNFDEQPMSVMRDAGLWLRAHGRPLSLVMDRKPYIPFFAEMRHIQLPDEPYEQIVRYAQRTGVEYLALEEYMLLSLRPQLLPLVTDSVFMERERRLRLVYMRRDQPLHGVAIFAVLGDSLATGR